MPFLHNAAMGLAVLTAIFIWVILSVTAAGTTTPGFAPLAIGLTLTVIHLISIPVSGTSVNPARSIATAIYGADWSRAQLWVFIIVPIVGGLVAGFTWKFLFGKVLGGANAPIVAAKK